MHVSTLNIGYTEGTWVPTFTGFSADPTGVSARYILIGKMCTIWVNMTAGTSNATTFTMTGPFTAANTTTQLNTGARIMNNGTRAGGGMVSTVANSTTINIYRDGVPTAFTASGNKEANFTLTFEIA